MSVVKARPDGHAEAPRAEDDAEPPPARRLAGHSAAMAVLLVGLLVTAALAVVSALLNRSNERHLLSLRAKEVASLLTEALPATETPLGAAVALADGTNGNRTKFMQFAGSYVGRGRPFVSLSIWRANDVAAGPVATEGTTPELSPTAPDAAGFFARAEAGSGLSVMLLHGAQPRIGYGYSGSGRSTFIAYGEGAIPARGVVRLPPNSAYSNLNIALYLGRGATPSELVLTTIRPLPLPGHRARATVPFGDTFVTVVVSARQPLGGALPRDVVWAVAIVGVLLTIGATLLTGRLVARRRRAQELAEENRRLYAEQRTIAMTLQRALLPSVFPRLDGIEIGARYEAGVRGIEVGGDWYDLILLDKRRLLMVVGDVSGRGLAAATAMASLRFAIQYAARESAPEVFLPRLTATHRVNTTGHMATVACAEIDLVSREVRVTSAGHLPLLLVANGSSEYLRSTVGPPVGVDPDAHYVSSTYPVPPGATLLGYTDGLVERRGEILDDGLERLRRAAAGVDGTVDELIDRVVEVVRGADAADDTAIAAIRWLD
jgi:hypothetical protein